MRVFELFEPIIDEGINDPGLFKAVFMAGPPGAGKNTVIKSLGLNAAGLKLQDVDKVTGHLKKIRPEFNYTDAGYSRSLNTTLRRQSLFQNQMLGLIINTTGRDSESIMALNQQLKESGYDTFMVFVEVDESIAWDRAQNRKKNATNPADAGRPVDKEYFDKAYPASMLNRDFYALAFGSHFACVTNNEDRVIEEDDDDPERTFSATFRRAYQKVQRFLNKPLTPKAQQIIGQVKSNRSNG